MTKLSGANLIGADLSGASLNRADLIEAKLGKSVLRGSRLTLAVLREANLVGADLSEADLTLANLRQADCSEANFGQATLKDTDLIGANLADTNSLEQTQIEQASGNKETLLPKHLLHPTRWLDVVQTNHQTELFPSGHIRLSPAPVDWVQNKITVISRHHNSPVDDLRYKTRGALSESQIGICESIAASIRASNADPRVAQMLENYAVECKKGADLLNILRLDTIHRTLLRLSRIDQDAIRSVDVAGLCAFRENHEALTNFYEVYREFIVALRQSNYITAPPAEDVVRVLTEPPGPEIIDPSVPEAVDEMSRALNSSLQGTEEVGEATEQKSRFGLLIALKCLWDVLNQAPKIEKILTAVGSIIKRLAGIWDWIERNWPHSWVQ